MGFFLIKRLIYPIFLDLGAQYLDLRPLLRQPNMEIYSIFQFLDAPFESTLNFGHENL